MEGILRFKVELQNIEPSIWRIIEVPFLYSFWDLHVAIQDAMGWLDCHLHEFNAGNKTIGLPLDGEDKSLLEGWKTPVCSHLKRADESFTYHYDFGDGWVHSITLLASEDAQVGITYPRCVDGERACPPEDCGGPAGYMELYKTLSGPDNEEKLETLSWLKNHAKNYLPFAPEEFDANSVEFTDPKKRLESLLTS